MVKGVKNFKNNRVRYRWRVSSKGWANYWLVMRWIVVTRSRHYKRNILKRITFASAGYIVNNLFLQRPVWSVSRLVAMFNTHSDLGYCVIVISIRAGQGTYISYQTSINNSKYIISCQDVSINTCTCCQACHFNTCHIIIIIISSSSSSSRWKASGISQEETGETWSGSGNFCVCSSQA